MGDIGFRRRPRVGEPQRPSPNRGAVWPPDDMPADETELSNPLLRSAAPSMLGNEDKVERYLLHCADLAGRAAVFHCAIGWYFQRRSGRRRCAGTIGRSVLDHHPCLFRRGWPTNAPSARGTRSAGGRAVWGSRPRQRIRGRQVGAVLFHLTRAPRPRVRARCRGPDGAAPSTPRPTPRPSDPSTCSPARVSCSCAGATSSAREGCSTRPARSTRRRATSGSASAGSWSSSAISTTPKRPIGAPVRSPAAPSPTCPSAAST
jgi:hypothetical protein